MSELLAENNVQIREHFVCDNDMKAEWCLSKIRRIRAEQNRENEELDRQMQFYQDQKEMIKQKADEDVAFFEEILRGYFSKRVDDGFTKATKTQTTYKLPSGKLVLKHQNPEYKRDDNAIITWLKSNDAEAFVKVKEEVAWQDLKNACIREEDGKMVFREDVDDDGVVTKVFLPGVDVIKRDDKFIVEVE